MRIVTTALPQPTENYARYPTKLLRIAEQRPGANHGGTAARALSGLMIFLAAVGRNLWAMRRSGVSTQLPQ